jgi:hypothetical protein
MSLFRRMSAEERLAVKEEKRRLEEERAAAQEAYDARLVKAASVSSVNLVCHKDTWAFVDSRLRNSTGYRPLSAGDVTHKPRNMVEVHISGPNLVTSLIVMGRLSASSWSYIGDRAIATRVYDAASEIVDSVDSNRNSETPVPPIVIDAEVGPPPNVWGPNTRSWW